MSVDTEENIQEMSDDELDETIFNCRDTILCHFEDNPQYLTDDLRKYYKELNEERAKRLDKAYKQKS